MYIFIQTYFMQIGKKYKDGIKVSLFFSYSPDWYRRWEMGSVYYQQIQTNIGIEINTFIQKVLLCI